MKDFKEREREGEGARVQGRAAIKGGERGIIRCEVMRLDLGLRKVQRESKGACLCNINTCRSDYIQERETNKCAETVRK